MLYIHLDCRELSSRTYLICFQSINQSINQSITTAMPTSSWTHLAKSSKYYEKPRRNGAEIYVKKRNL